MKYQHVNVKPNTVIQNQSDVSNLNESATKSMK